MVAVLALGLYFLTCAPGVLWLDSAIFQGRVYQGDYLGRLGLALAHPLYIFLARCWAALPLGDFAFRVNLFSAVCAALTVGVAFDLLLGLTRSRAAAACGSILLAVSHTFWTHAVIAEVYSLYGLTTLVECWLLARFMRTRRRGWLWAAAAVNGLSVANHLLALLHLPVYGVLLLALLRSKAIRWRDLAGVIAAYVVGAAPYWGLMVAQWRGGQAVGDVVRSALFGNSEFQGKVLNTHLDWGRQLLRTAQYFILNFPTPLALAAPIGLVAAWRDRSLRWFAGVLAGLFVVNFAFAVRYTVPDQYVFFYSGYLVIPMAAGLGAGRLLAARPRWTALAIALAVLPAGVYEALPSLVRRAGVNFGVRRAIPYRDNEAFFLRPRKNGDDGAGRFAREALAAAAPDGLLIADPTIRNLLVVVRDIDQVETGVAIEDGTEVRQRGPSVTVTRDSVRPFAMRGRAFICDRTPDYHPAWLDDLYSYEPVSVVYRLTPKN